MSHKTDTNITVTWLSKILFIEVSLDNTYTLQFHSAKSNENENIKK